MRRLKKCPSCGSKAKLQENAFDQSLGGEHKIVIECTGCPLMIEDLWMSKDDAIAHWNNRPDEMPEYKPCPFCGEEKNVVTECQNAEWITGCTKCIANVISDTKLKSILTWNKRVFANETMQPCLINGKLHVPNKEKAFPFSNGSYFGSLIDGREVIINIVGEIPFLLIDSIYVRDENNYICDVKSISQIKNYGEKIL